MRESRAFQIGLIGGLVVLIAWLVELLADDGLSQGAIGTLRIVVVAAAVVCAGALYQLWSVRKHHTVRDHAAVAAALLGGALVASSAFSAPTGQVFASSLTAATGVAGLAIALYGFLSVGTGTEGHRS